ncbi:ABC transporter permease [Albimonas pacifica]|uniref:Capsular polysaccharide transport system permease protein n=1 Tax=Albimonas pacifica TaxID=1114924 RepID=A0A1I3C3T2_9RHOB|nr:ABC transporter permease [Albimonas pacifica]SFH69204.1 capsular polysaccharide transport system permease protein [Albimonas pacifica]
MATTNASAADSPLRVHRRVVIALLRREMSTKYGRSMGGYFWAVAEPCGMIFIMSFAWSFMSRSPDLGQSFVVFFGSGFLSFNFYRNTAAGLFTVVRNNSSLLKYPNVNIWDAIVARTLLQTLTNCMVMVLILGIAGTFTGETLSLDFPRIAGALSVATLLGVGMGTLNAVLFHIVPTWERIFKIINRPLFIISGVLYTPESRLVPGPAMDFLALNPLVHVISAFREGIYPVYHARLNHLEYPLAVGLVMLFFGLLLLRRYDERLLER